MSHKKLLLKLANLGGNDGLCRWIEAFLIARQQRVKIKGLCSSWTDVLSGVPQGSVLGPLLFVIYINDITKDMKTPTFLYADEMKICRAIKSADDRLTLQRDLESVARWTERWGLSLNLSKCGVMNIGHRGEEKIVYDIPLGGDKQRLNNITSEKDLGILVDDELEYEAHIAEIIQKANKTLGIIKRNFRNIGIKTFLLLYKAMVRSKLEYAQNVWSPYKMKYIEKIEKVQRRATKLLPNLCKKSYEERLRKIGLPTLAYRRVRGDMIEVYKILHGLYDYDGCPNLPLATYNVTRGHNLKLKKTVNKTARLHSFTVRVVELWNNLPSEVVNSPNVNVFKGRLDKHWKSEDLVFDFKAVINRSRKPEI